jgi:RimJ/RimL family protein N-acetyltransferase
MMVQGKAVANWLAERTEEKITSIEQAIGQLQSGKLVAAAAYYDYNGNNIFASIAIDSPPTKEFWRGIFAYPFEQLGCRRITAYVDDCNTKSIRLLEKMGFKLEATLEDAAPDGKDYLIYRMKRDECRQLNWGKKHG